MENEEIKNFIQLKRRNTFRVGIKDEQGNIKKDNNGNDLYLEFDLEDIELPLKYNKSEFLVRKAKQDLRRDLIIIDKKQDVKGKMLLSKNEEDKTKAIKKYYKTMEEAMDLFIGKGGVQKIFGDVRYFKMFDDLSEILKPILPLLKKNLDNSTEIIKEKYKNKKDDILIINTGDKKDETLS